MLIGRDRIAGLIPHAGAMCLLDEVDAWDAASITCRTMSHRSCTNPLRRAGRLGILCGIEYAAQAMALHAALNAPAGSRPNQGYLASLRGVSFSQDRLDLLDGALTVEAICQHQENGRAIYDFALKDAERGLPEGRPAVVLEGRPAVVLEGRPAVVVLEGRPVVVLEGRAVVVLEPAGP